MTQLDPSIQVVAFTGAARSGKDTAARLLREHLNEYNEIVPFSHATVVGTEAFAGPIKSMIAILLDFFGKGHILETATLLPYIDGEKKEEQIPEIGASPRELMQTLGTEWGRKQVGENLWVNCMTTRLRAYEEAVKHGYQGAKVLVTDCRFDNEAKALRELGIPIIRVVRSVADLMVDKKTLAHESEKGVSDEYITATILNDGSLLDLKDALTKVLPDFLPAIPTEAEAEELWARWEALTAPPVEDTLGDTQEDKQEATL